MRELTPMDADRWRSPWPALRKRRWRDCGIRQLSLIAPLLFAICRDALMLMSTRSPERTLLFEDGDPISRLELHDSQRTCQGNMILRSVAFDAGQVLADVAASSSGA